MCRCLDKYTNSSSSSSRRGSSGSNCGNFICRQLTKEMAKAMSGCVPFPLPLPLSLWTWLSLLCVCVCGCCLASSISQMGSGTNWNCCESQLFGGFDSAKLFPKIIKSQMWNGKYKLINQANSIMMTVANKCDKSGLYAALSVRRPGMACLDEQFIFIHSLSWTRLKLPFVKCLFSCWKHSLSLCSRLSWAQLQSSEQVVIILKVAFLCLL